jgi:hypothetical protein
MEASHKLIILNYFFGRSNKVGLCAEAIVCLSQNEEIKVDLFNFIYLMYYMNGKATLLNMLFGPRENYEPSYHPDITNSIPIQEIADRARNIAREKNINICATINDLNGYFSCPLGINFR